MDTKKSIPSPFQNSNDPAVEILAKILKHLDLLRMPVLTHHMTKQCSRDCHIIERNHTIEAVKHFIENGCKLE